MFGYKKVLAISKDKYDEYLEDYYAFTINGAIERFVELCSEYDVVSVVLKLEIPEDAVVVTPETPDNMYFLAKSPIKHRCSKAMPVSAAIVSTAVVPYGSLLLENYVLFSRFDPHFTYEIGKMAIPDSFDPDMSSACSHGIHFFATVGDAIDY